MIANIQRPRFQVPDLPKIKTVKGRNREEQTGSVHEFSWKNVLELILFGLSFDEILKMSFWIYNLTS